MTQLQPSEFHAKDPGLALRRLRSATFRAHEQLEASLAIAGTAPTDADVRAWFSTLHGWLDPVERRLWGWPWPEAMRAPDRAAKARWLAADLYTCDIEATRLPECTEALRLPDLASHFGFAYVVEGSMLGGRVLATRLAQLGSKYAGSRFLRGYGAATADMWRDFCTQLEVHLGSAAERATAATAAASAFAHLRRWLATAGLLQP